MHIDYFEYFVSSDGHEENFSSGYHLIRCRSMYLKGQCHRCCKPFCIARKCKWRRRRNVDMMRMLGYAKCPYREAQNSREVLYSRHKTSQDENDNEGERASRLQGVRERGEAIANPGKSLAAASDIGWRQQRIQESCHGHRVAIT